jgi:hypothetical protein
VKRVISVTVGLLLGVSLWSGPAWAETSHQSDDVQLVAANPFAGVFSQVETTLSQVGVFSPLRALLDAIAAQLDALEAHLAQLYDELFIETCPTCESEL